MRLARQLSRLGTETAFAVSGEAAQFAKTGRKVYPFHLGDLNIPTPANIVKATFEAIEKGKTGYCAPQGILELRELLANDINQSHGTSYTADNVVVQPGGKPVVGKFLLALMNPGDKVLYPNPGYPIYESLIEFHGGIPVPYAYHETQNGFALDVDQIERSIDSQTSILFINNPQNPTGAESDAQELAHLAQVIRKHNLSVLCDEAYFDIRYDGPGSSLMSLPGMQEHCVVLYTFSKKFAMTGWRLGAAVGPKAVVEAIAKLNVNHESCSNHFAQYGAVEALSGPQDDYHRLIDTLRDRRDRIVTRLNSIEGIRCYPPSATFYVYANVTDLMHGMGVEDYEEFRKHALQATGVSFCTRLHFGRRPDDESSLYIRFAYSGIEAADIEEGLIELKRFAEQA